MNILMAASEATPLAKSGGLADVAGALPKALKQRGADVRIIMPKYEQIPDYYIQNFERIAEFYVNFGWRSQYCGLFRAEIDGVVFYLIDNEFYFGRRGLYGYNDDAERFVFYSVAVMEAVRYLDYKPDIVHCHDWQAGLIPVLLRTRYSNDPAWDGVKSVFTIHNLMYQGLFGIDLLKELLGAGDEMFTADKLEFHGAASCLKGGLVYADKLTTVSESYAREIQSWEHGEKLDGLLSSRSGDLTGIINGIDTELYDPMNDDALHTPYRSSISRKRKNKLSLQAELGLPESEETPLIGIISRLVESKGMDLITWKLDELMQEDVQLVVLGAGDWHYENSMNHLVARYPNKAAVWLGYNDRLARRIYAGSDIFLMPSRFEPCGLSQLLALRYRSIPVVRETGGLKDTVFSYNEETGEGNGFSFTHYNADDFMYTVRRALHFYRDDAVWRRIVDNAGKEDYSWSRSAKAYIALYDQLLASRKGTERWPVTL
ncbi:glycogen synthase GlgA [Paenibacillus glycanilyticus]|uniref:glycogen synthase GlgA n=1 Tax=Paenibacillus glycanilyticus TaxID=126569 RepID=UPI0019107D93|nr:glycogen synthase GlgA [Paenibacillus glycanilyticus]